MDTKELPALALEAVEVEIVAGVEGTVKETTGRGKLLGPGTGRLGVEAVAEAGRLSAASTAKEPAVYQVSLGKSQ